MKKLNVIFNENWGKKWLILVVDICISVFALFFAFQTRFNFELGEQEIFRLKNSFLMLLTVRMVFFLIFRTYADIIRYTSTKDALRVIFALLLGSLTFFIVDFVLYYILNKPFIIPISIIIIEFFISVVLLVGIRVLIKLAFLEIQNPSREKKDVIIFGAGNSGLITKRSLDRDAGTKYKVIAFIDEDEKKVGMKVEGIPICNFSEMLELLSNNSIAHVIISIADLPSEKKNLIAEAALKCKAKVLVVPPVVNWINGELSFKQIKKIKIEELLQRDVISIDNKKISEYLTGQVILITGAAGSIGSEIVRQVVRFNPQHVLCIDQSETGLFNLGLDLNTLSSSMYRLIVGDICDEEKMRKLFDIYRPSICFHAAAYKHVPLMESHVSDAMHNNVFGTKLLADLALEYQCKRFVMISTDKAVNPTSVMGASKRMAEIYVQSLAKTQKTTTFITTRFGNVLGSNGSVIPLFRQQIENGGPLTVTHPEVTRYFMTIKEACQLVLEAGVMGKGGEIFIFDMGNSVKIVDLAKKMIQLSGLTLGKDIQIAYTGLRPGEKLYEELLNKAENTVPTYHNRILIASVREYEIEQVRLFLDELNSIIQLGDEFEIVGKLKSFIPEYLSQNSVFQQLDKQ